MMTEDTLSQRRIAPATGKFGETEERAPRNHGALPDRDAFEKLFAETWGCSLAHHFGKGTDPIKFVA